MYAKIYPDSPEVKLCLFKAGVTQRAIPKVDPIPVPSPGLSPSRQWYLFESIREYCPERSKDILCPMPSVPKPKQKDYQSDKTSNVAVPGPSNEKETLCRKSSATSEGKGNASKRKPSQSRKNATKKKKSG